MSYFFRFLILTLFLILIYTFYRSEVIWQGSRRDFYLIYYVITLLTIFFLITVYYFKLKIQRYLIIIFVVLFLHYIFLNFFFIEI